MNGPHSLTLLAALGAREAGADGYAIHQIDRDLGTLALISAQGAPVLDGVGEDTAVVSFPLRSRNGAMGTLQFVFRDKAASRERRAALGRIAALAESVWRLWHTRLDHLQLAARVVEGEAELVDSKISDRVRGMLDRNREGGGAVDVIERHVEAVLRPSAFTTVLAQASREVEGEIEERRLMAEAKAFLQGAYGMSEEEAHKHLRSISRKSRRPLTEVSREFLEARNSLRLHPV